MANTETITTFRRFSAVSLGPRIVVIGTSAGGVTALRGLVSRFEPDWHMCVFITMHVGGSSALPGILSWNSRVPVQFAAHDEPFRTGVYVAPPDRHLLLGATKTFLSAGPKENHTRPAIDPMFRSAARHHGARVIGVLLTGYLHDGVNGLYEIHSHGGCTIVQDPAEATVPEMPLNALLRLSPDYTLPLSQIPNAIAEQLHETNDAAIRRRQR